MIGRPSLIAPIQTRGIFQADQHEPRVRIATRGPLLQSFPFDDDVKLATAVTELRRGRDLPLTIVISAAGWSPAQDEGDRFLEVLLKCTDRRIDAIWRISPQPLPWSPPAADPVPNVVTLDLSTSLDSRIANNLLADLLFLPAADAADKQLLHGFRNRAPFVVVPCSGAHRDEIVSLAYEAGFAVLHWDSDTKKIGRDAMPSLPSMSTETPPSAEGVDLDAIGKYLFDLAKFLKGRREKRSVFRNALAELGARYGEYPRWDEDLVRMADSHKWPDWAVQTLPSLYLRTSDDDAAEISAFVWHPLTKWIDKPEQYLDGAGRICNDEMWQMRLPAEIAAVLSEIHTQINENLRGNPLHGDGVFFGRIWDAVDAVFQAKKQAGDPVAQQLQALSRVIGLMAQKR